MGAATGVATPRQKKGSDIFQSPRVKAGTQDRQQGPREKNGDDFDQFNELVLPSSQLGFNEHETLCVSIEPDPSLSDTTKVAKLVVDNWFVDKGFGFGKVHTGEIVFIHASAVVGAEALKIGTDAWVQVVNDDARIQGGIKRAELGGVQPGKKRSGANG